MMPQKVLITTSVQKLKEELDKRFKIYETNMSLILATFLDVNNRLRYFPGENQLYSLENITKELYKEYANLRELSDNKEDDEPQDDPTETTEVNSQKEHHGVTNEGKKTVRHYGATRFPAKVIPMQKVTQKKSIKDAIDLDIKMYMSQEVSELEPPHSLLWWKENKEDMPHLARLASKFICGPPSSADSERLFSIGGRILTPHRSRLLPENADKLMRTCHNLRHFKQE